MSETFKFSNDPKRNSVCFFNFDLGFGGTEKVIVSLANHFSSNGINVTILTLNERNDFVNFIQMCLKIDQFAETRLFFLT